MNPVAMKVPDELIEAAYELGLGLESREATEAVLEAVLPKVRERLKATTPYSDEMKSAIDYAFDHAFPEEES